MRPGTIHRDCGGTSAHNFYDSDAAVMAAVAEWINNGAAPVNINQEKAQQQRTTADEAKRELLKMSPPRASNKRPARPGQERLHCSRSDMPGSEV
jgi:hypothetical protein